MSLLLTLSWTTACLFLLIRAEDTFDCTGYEDDSFHPIYDADDCRHYWHCIYVDTVYMHAVRRVCPSGTEFDSVLRQCETSSLVTCVPVKSPHGPRTSTTTRAWKWRYSRLFSRKRWKTTMATLYTTRKHPVFDLEDPPELETTTNALMDEEMTTETTRVLPLIDPSTTTPSSLEQLSNNLFAFALHSRLNKNKPVVNFFQPGDPHNEADLYSTTSRPTRRSRRTTTTSAPLLPQFTSAEMTTEMPLTTVPIITDNVTTISTPLATNIVSTASPIITMITTTTSITTAAPSTMAESDTTMDLLSRARLINGQRRRKNMTLYILTSDDHKIRQFSLNHTRGILVNCEQLRRRLLGGRRLRDILLTTTDQSLLARQTSSSPSMADRFSSVLLLWTFVSWFMLIKIG